MSAHSTTPPTSPQKRQSLKRQQSYSNQKPLSTGEKHKGHDIAQNPSPTKKRKFQSEVRLDNGSATSLDFEMDTVMSLSHGLEEFPALHIQDVNVETKKTLEQGLQVATVPMIEFIHSLSPQPTIDELNNVTYAINFEIKGDYVTFKVDERVDVGRVGVSSRPSCPMAQDGTPLPYTGPEKYRPLTKAHDLRSLTLLQFTDCPNLITLVEQRGQNHANGTITETARLMFNHLWSMAWGFNMAKLAEMDASEDSDFRKLMQLVMVEYQDAETKRVLAFNALGYRN